MRLPYGHGTPDRATDRAALRAAANQAPPLVGHDVVSADLALAEAVLRHGSAEVLDDLRPLGARPAPPRPASRARWPTSTTPSSRRTTATATGSTRSSFHPSWHWLMERAVGHGLAATPWERRPTAPARPRAPRRRLHGLVAHRARPRLPDLDDLRRRARRCAPTTRWPRSGRRCWPPPPTTRACGRSRDKRGALAGMGMTEKQGGSDVRANVTEARPTSGRRRATRCTATSGSPRRR